MISKPKSNSESTWKFYLLRFCWCVWWNALPPLSVVNVSPPLQYRDK